MKQDTGGSEEMNNMYIFPDEETAKKAMDSLIRENSLVDKLIPKSHQEFLNENLGIPWSPKDAEGLQSHYDSSEDFMEDKSGNGNHLIKGYIVEQVFMDEFEYRCEVCNKGLEDYDPEYCCDGRECGCHGQPSFPPICSELCYHTSMGNKLERFLLL